MLEVEVFERRYRVELQDGKVISVSARILEEFGQRAPQVYWRPVWTAAQRAPGCLVRAVIAEAMIAVSYLELEERAAD
jgi:hypothetical protein